MKLRRIMLSPLLVAMLSLLASAQTLTDPGDSSDAAAATVPAQLDLTYTRPTTKTKLHSYIFETFGPYPIVGAAIAAGINQADNTHRSGARCGGYGERFGSDFGITR